MKTFSRPSLRPVSLLALTATCLLLAAPIVRAQAPKPAPSKTKYLAIGDPAPLLQPAKWVKGTPVQRFESGKLYVVEFWATWCGPCKENIPHLTRLAAKYKDRVSVIGVSIWEDAKGGGGDTTERVRKFVAGQGAAMDYIVAADGPTNTIADSWMKPAGQDGIPCSFIVGKDGKIAWIGYPTEMDTVLEQLIAGNYDASALKAKREADTRLMRPISEAMAAKDYSAAATAIETALAKKPELLPGLAYSYLLALFHTDPKKGMATGRKILTEAKAAGAYQLIGSLFASQSDLSPESYRFGISVLDEALQQWPADYMYNAMKANAYFHLGEKAKAIQVAQDALTAAENSPQRSPEAIALIKKSIEHFQAAK